MLPALPKLVLGCIKNVCLVQSMKSNTNVLWIILLLISPHVTAAEIVDSGLTEHGQPDLQGIWYYGTATPMERPVALGNLKAYSESEVEKVLTAIAAADANNQQALDPNRAPPETGAAIFQEADHNFASMRTNLVQIDGEYRTSQIVSPDNGRFPLRENAQDYYQQLTAAGHGAFDGPEIRPGGERCVGPTGGPAAPMVGWFYNANLQIYQTQDYFVINAEMNHDARIIPLTESAAELSYPQWMGYSVGSWQEDTLIVETSRFRPEQSWFAFRHSDQLQVREEFKLISNDEIFYRFTATDSEIYTEPLVVEKTLSRRPAGEYIYEYSCHEGNYSMPSILLGARRQELDAQSQQ